MLDRITGAQFPPIGASAAVGQLKLREYCCLPNFGRCGQSQDGRERRKLKMWVKYGNFLDRSSTHSVGRGPSGPTFVPTPVCRRSLVSGSIALWSVHFIRLNGSLRHILTLLITPLDIDQVRQKWEDSNMNPSMHVSAPSVVHRFLPCGARSPHHARTSFRLLNAGECQVGGHCVYPAFLFER